MTRRNSNTRRPPDLFARYLDDLEVGDSFTTKGRTITEADLVNFAALTWDTYPLHVDAEWASKTMFGERIAHGMLVLSYAAGPGADAAGPDRRLLRDGEGALLRAHQDRRHDPRARRAEGEGGPRRRHIGLATFHNTILNQRDETVCKSINKVVLKRRADA